MSATHDLVLNKIFGVARRHGEARLVARLNRPDLFHDPSGLVRVFIPDMHLLSIHDQSHYLYSFDHDEANGHLRRGELLAELLDELRPHAAAVCELHQLGDFADLWRSFDDDGLRALETILARRDYPFLDPLADRALFVAGNHDQELTATGAVRAEKSRLFPHGVLVTHGDGLDPVEDMGRLNEVAVRLLSEGHGVTEYDLRVPVGRLLKGAVPLRGIDPGAPPDAVNVRYATWSRKFLDEWKSLFNASAGTSLDFRAERADILNAHELLLLGLDAKTRLADAAGRSWDDVPTDAKRRLKRLGMDGAPVDTSVRLIVVGHSHRARIVVAEEVDFSGDPTGERFVLMDCGAWIERSIMEDSAGKSRTRPSCQIGVQCGADLRIYQIDLTGAV
jgi:UDP-2,3-diacylglucosamine pyrophosphatase LpxH